MNAGKGLSITHLGTVQSVVVVDNNHAFGWEATLHLHVLGRGPGQWVSFLDQPTYPNVLQRH